jgi:hypothetical protein
MKGPEQVLQVLSFGAPAVEIIFFGYFLHFKNLEIHSRNKVLLDNRAQKMIKLYGL